MSQIEGDRRHENDGTQDWTILLARTSLGQLLEFAWGLWFRWYNSVHANSKILRLGL